MGGITEIATGAPGYNSVLPNTMSPLAKTLKLNGYSTAQFGKCHEVPVWETSPAGPFNAWPTGGGGFEYFYGFIGGEANQWYPTLYEGTTPVEPETRPRGLPPDGGHDGQGDWLDRAAEEPRSGQAVLHLLRTRRERMRPITSRRNGPTSTKASSMAVGTSFERRRSHARRTRCDPGGLSVDRAPQGNPELGRDAGGLQARVAPRDGSVAGFMEYTDHHVGRLVDALSALGIADDTIIYYIAGDNGASAEGVAERLFQRDELLQRPAGARDTRIPHARIDKLGGPELYNHYGVGWAHAMNTPYQWTKQVASHWGGTRNGTIVHWPKGIKAKGEIRSQFSHVIDVAPTVLEAAGIPEPLSVDGLAQSPIERLYALRLQRRQGGGAARDAVLRDVRQPRHLSPGMDGGQRHTYPWSKEKAPALDDDIWELYDTTKDWSQSKNLAKEMPESFAIAASLADRGDTLQRAAHR